MPAALPPRVEGYVGGAAFPSSASSPHFTVTAAGDWGLGIPSPSQRNQAARNLSDLSHHPTPIPQILNPNLPLKGHVTQSNLGQTGHRFAMHDYQ